MTKQLIDKGLELAAKLDELATEFHVKSDVHEIFSWEAVGIRTRVNDLIESNTDARKDTRYKGFNLGDNLHKYNLDISEEVCSFTKNTMASKALNKAIKYAHKKTWTGR